MCETLLSVGLDVGTTTTQLVVSRLHLENRASGFAVPEMHITQRDIVYESPVHFTPLLDMGHVDGARICQLVAAEYEKAQITRSDVDTGAIIITGETSRKENARAVMDALAEFAGDFVVTTAGPHLESVLAAKGAGAVAFSCKSEKPVLHMDIGGGTSNLALIENGKIVRTGCLNVGGRLIKLSQKGEITYVSPVLAGITELRAGDIPAKEQLVQLAQLFARALEMAAGLRPPDALFEKLLTREAGEAWLPPEGECSLCFSGGVAECTRSQQRMDAFGDIGVYLGSAIKQSALCRGAYRLGTQTIRATVIGAGCYSAQLSGSTVFCQGVSLPLKNLPVICMAQTEQENASLMAQRLKASDADTVVLAMPGYRAPDYARLKALAHAIAHACTQKDVIVCLHEDMAKALGQYLRLILPHGRGCLCLDRVKLSEQSYLDIGTPVGPCFPPGVKTLVLSQEG